MSRYRIIYKNSNIEAPMGRFEIGRSEACNLVLDDPGVSRLHAAIVRDESGLFLEDLGSRNGCVVNGRHVSGRVALAHGDEITIGKQSIRISTVVASESRSRTSAKNTMSLRVCPVCGDWMTAEDAHCRTCHPDASAGDHDTPGSQPASSLGAEAAAPSATPRQMLLELASKALGKKKYDETSQLLSSMMERFLAQAQEGAHPNEADLLDVTELVIALAVAEKNPEHISALFAFYQRMRRLMPRKGVEALYQDIRKTGYRVCPEMTRYLGVLAELSRGFSPGDKFIHRRIEGLVGLCS
ncbi:MAG: FHA domain-containing protein [Proteobacteria bacterium]|nr:FHA domain-containing protein [Pseudomonadota bacterium]